eukprot:5449174-Prymnesium_polylepis.1
MREVVGVATRTRRDRIACIDDAPPSARITAAAVRGRRRRGVRKACAADCVDAALATEVPRTETGGSRSSAPCLNTARVPAVAGAESRQVDWRAWWLQWRAQWR